jgi:hypothetical protein
MAAEIGGVNTTVARLQTNLRDAVAISRPRSQLAFKWITQDVNAAEVREQHFLAALVNTAGL